MTSAQFDLNPFLVFTLAVAASMLAIPLVSKVAPFLGLLDQPDPRKVHTTPVPRVGGWGITLGAIVPLLVSLQLGPLLQSYVLAVVVLFVFGVWDDARQLGHWTKFAGQFAAVAIVIWHGDLYVTQLPFDLTLDPLAGKLFTMFALVGVINATNHSDGLDGLAAGESLLSLIGVAVLGYVVGDKVLVGVSLATLGGILGFLRYNSHPARVFMGDSGSQVLGLTLGFLVVYLTQVAHTAISAALPLLLLGLPIADILVVLYQRIRSGGSWFKATRNHVHHRLLDLGFDHYETVIIIYTIQALLVVSAVPLRYQDDFAVAAAYLSVVGALFLALHAAERSGWRLRKLGGSGSRVAVLVERFSASRALKHTPLIVISIVVPGFMLLGSLWVATVPRDFAVVAGVLAAVVAAEMLRAPAAGSLAARAAIYATAIFTAYLFINYPGLARPRVEFVTVLALGILAVAIAIHVRFAATKQEFGTTPTDYLIVFGVIALTVFGTIDIDSRSAVELVAYTTVLLYGCEVAISVARRTRLLHAAALGALTILAVRGVVASF
jgi:UDP-GlcNAc:undecaprenyl-phosphate GlcNAc-1-phosphate transferase